jgi:hypothetical protein
MKLVQSQSYKKANNGKWNYKGYTCWIDLDHEDDGNVKAFHRVISPEGRQLRPDISPYDQSQATVNLWIDAGCPARPQGFNWDRTSLQKLVQSKQPQSQPPIQNNPTGGIQ